jgi:hypothetical protein
MTPQNPAARNYQADCGIRLKKTAFSKINPGKGIHPTPSFALIY